MDAIARDLGASVRTIYRMFERLGMRPKDMKKGTP
jgi:predicted DNA-binding transcriptional regulator YafY